MNIIAYIALAVVCSIWFTLLGWMIVSPIVNELQRIADFVTSFEVQIEEDDKSDN
ncbi:MAG: hypothetical protein J5725_03605 [Bacteroidales bacterium]|nr:hypothetical protein [Bacteroidales bacterium]